MNKIVILAVLAGIAVFSTGCMTDYRSPSGGLVTSLKFHKNIPSKIEVGSKTGKACASNILLAVSTGDASLSTAALNGGITNIHSVDYEKFSISLFYTKLCTIVHGT